jgi:hypothetical protein
MKIISLGLGVQSTAIYFMSSSGQLPRCDYAIFSDPGREKKETMDYLVFLQNWQKSNNGIPIIVVNDKNLFTDLLANTNSSQNRFASIPAFTKDENGNSGMLRRQCTNEYKIAQVDKAIKAIYGLSKKARFPKTEIWIGITLDERARMTVPERQKWKILTYPFCGYQVDYTGKAVRYEQQKFVMTRNDLLNWYKSNNLPIPVKSSCIFCPFQSDVNWLELKRNHPEDFADAVKIDKVVRDSSKRGIQQPIYLHNSCKPLDEVQFDALQGNLWGDCGPFCHT